MSIMIQQANSPVAENVAALIRSQGLVQASVAKRAGFTPWELSAMLNGRRQIHACDIAGIARALGVSPGDLFQGT